MRTDSGLCVGSVLVLFRWAVQASAAYRRRSRRQLRARCDRHAGLAGDWLCRAARGQSERRRRPHHGPLAPARRADSGGGRCAVVCWRHDLSHPALHQSHRRASREGTAVAESKRTNRHVAEQLAVLSWRVQAETEEEGIDSVYHGEFAYDNMLRLSEATRLRRPAAIINNSSAPGAGSEPTSARGRHPEAAELYSS
jgi:hypothetical protein